MLLKHNWTWDEFVGESEELEQKGGVLSSNVDDGCAPRARSVASEDASRGVEGKEQNKWNVDDVDFHVFNEENKNSLFFGMLLA